MSIYLLTQIAAALWQSTSDRPPDSAVLVALIAGLSGIAVAIVTAVLGNKRTNRANERTAAVANDTADLQALYVSLAQEFGDYKKRAGQTERSLRTRIEHMEEQGREQNQRITELETYINQVDGVLSGAPDDATIGSLRPQLPVKPAPRPRRPPKKEREADE